MKKTILTMIAVVVALWAAANDRFYIEDFSISAGETKQVSIILENTVQYTAFQTDIYLPEGLTVEKEDDEYAFELTSRKSRDHVIFGEDRPDGAIRLMSYSMQVKPFTGNSGSLVTFNITASDNFSGGPIELKYTLFTDMTDQEISFVNESCQVQLQLKKLTGKIRIEFGGKKTTQFVISDVWDYGFLDVYDYLYISYSGEEQIKYSIFVNGQDLLNDENYSRYVSWDDPNKRYIIDLWGLSEYELWCLDDDHYSMPSGHSLLYFYSTVYSDGYELIYSYFQDHRYFNPETERCPSILEFGISDLTYCIDVEYNSSNTWRFSYCPEGNLVIDNNDIYCMGNLYAVERLDHDYYITIGAAQHVSNHDDWITTASTFLVPARTCSLSISQYDSVKPIQDCFILDNESLFRAGEIELGTDFAIIESRDWNIDRLYDGFNSDLIFNVISLSISIDNQQINDIYGLENQSVAINLLPYENIYGGEHYIETIICDSLVSWYNKALYCNALSIDTIVVHQPVTTRLTPDSFILDVDSGMCNAMLRVNGEEVDLSTDGDALYYAFNRRNNDYSVTVQVGDKVTNEYGEVYTAWSQETTIIVPTILRPGDANGDGIVNVSDVTLLISKILGDDVEPFITENADLTGEGTLNVADVTALIQLILNN